MVRITKEEYDRIGNDYKSTYQDYQGNHPEWVGRRCAFLPGYGTILFIEGSALKLFNLPPGSRTRGGTY